MENLKIRFNNLTLYKKILLIVSITLVCTYLVFFLSIHVLTGRYEKELYQASAQALNHVSSSITAELQAIEAVSTNLISDSVIQDNLLFLKDNPRSNRGALARRDIYQGLYPYTFYDNYIKSINIVLDDGTNICMGSNSDIEKFDEAAMSEAASAAEGRLVWELAMTAGGDVAASREIRQLKYLDLRRLASLYIIIDMESLIRDSLKNAGYAPESSRFVLMADGKRFYPEAAYHDDLYGGLIASMNRDSNSYLVTTLDKNKEFIITGCIPYTGWDYLYFRDYDPIFHDIQSARLQILVFSACFGLIALLLVQTVFRHILKHLDFLVEKIRCFGNGEPAPEDRREYDYRNRKDEIGQLHVNFDEMTKSVKVLRDENYDKQLLLRDATIKMLQQQINPHFLYNTLDTINWMAQKYGADDISTMVRSLGNLFRASITGQDDLIPLADELSVLDNYIQIQKIRFKDRLVFELVTPEDISHIHVPKLCIQPLVENALKHAMEYTDEICTIRVTIREQEDNYRIKVANTGSQFEDDLLWKIEHKQITPQGSGVGLVNIDSRLKLIYGDHYGLTFYNKDGMAVVMLSIPKEREDAHAQINDCR
ncbi:MAG: sensor histidine kinase [Clostridiales bacterium]|nr:sensor histidine kinase [Clostridiales bacterium]